VWAPRPELYDVAGDPGELRNEATEDPGRAGVYHRHLESIVRDVLSQDLLAGESYSPDDATREELAALGYVSGSGGEGPGSAEAEMELVGYDPKDLVDVSMAAREIQNGFYESGERKLLRFFANTRTPEEDPRMARLWAAAHQNYAKIWLVRGEYAKAAAEYRRSMEADPGYDLARWSLVYALNLAGEPDRAVHEADRILERWPNSWRVRLHRGLAYALLDRGDAAREELTAVATGADPGGAPARHARWYLERLGTPREAEALQSYLDSEKRRGA
jgi:tetratricopeptide (TPR) repeat protein